MAIRQRPKAGATRTRVVKPREQMNWQSNLRNVSTVLVLLILIVVHLKMQCVTQIFFWGFP